MKKVFLTIITFLPFLLNAQVADYFVAYSDTRAIHYTLPKKNVEIGLDLSKQNELTITIPDSMGNREIKIKITSIEKIKAEDINIFINDKKQIKE